MGRISEKAWQKFVESGNPNDYMYYKTVLQLEDEGYKDE